MEQKAKVIVLENKEVEVFNKEKKEKENVPVQEVVFTWNDRDSKGQSVERKCYASVFGKSRIENTNLSLGAEGIFSFDIDAHEYNGRWYNKISIWRFVPSTQSAPAPQPAAPTEPEW